MFLGDIGHGVGDGRAVRTEHRIDLVLCDQFLVKANSGLLIRAIVINHKLDRTSKDSALRIHMLLAQQVSLPTVAALHRVSLSGDRHRGPNPDRLLGHARPRHPDNEHAEKDNDQAVHPVRSHDCLLLEVRFTRGCSPGAHVRRSANTQADPRAPRPPGRACC